MKSEEVNKELSLSYQELVAYLLDKYGPAKHDYFVNESCKTKSNKVSRTDEGLLCHHIDEDKAIMLSDTKWAAQNPFEYQKADRLVYCNVLEHLILHIKIFEEPKALGANLLEAQGIGGAVNFICPQINDYYNGFEFKRPYEQKIYGVIADNFEEYIKILRYFLDVLYDKRPRFLDRVNEETLATGFMDRHIIKKVYDRIA